MTTLRGEEDLDSGYLAVLGHQLLGSVSVVQGSMETLRRADRMMSEPNRALLENAIERHLERVVEAARSLIQGNLVE